MDYQNKKNEIYLYYIYKVIVSRKEPSSKYII